MVQEHPLNWHNATLPWFTESFSRKASLEPRGEKRDFPPWWEKLQSHIAKGHKCKKGAISIYHSAAPHCSSRQGQASCTVVPTLANSVLAGWDPPATSFRWMPSCSKQPVQLCVTAMVTESGSIVTCIATRSWVRIFDSSLTYLCDRD